MVVPNRLRDARLARGDSQRTVAAAVGKSHTLVSLVERGQRGCSDVVKIAFAEYFGVPVSELFVYENGNKMFPDAVGASA